MPPANATSCAPAASRPLVGADELIDELVALIVPFLLLNCSFKPAIIVGLFGTTIPCVAMDLRVVGDSNEAAEVMNNRMTEMIIL